jgi:hypothetical protein
MVKEKADLRVVVDPDVDRLAFICEDGEMFGENIHWWLVRIMWEQIRFRLYRRACCDKRTKRRGGRAWMRFNEKSQTGGDGRRNLLALSRR